MTEEQIGLLFIGILYLSTIVYVLSQIRRQKTLKLQGVQKRLLLFAKVNLALITLALISIAVLAHTNFLNYKSPMPYSKIGQITFSDFRGIELFKKTSYGSEKFAYVVTSVEMDTAGDSIELKAVFHPARSFVYNEFSYNPELLKHELYHFKVTELFTRKLKEHIDGKSGWTKEKLQAAYTDFMQKESDFQQQYDHDTFHSYVAFQQKKYEREIDSCLFLLNRYEPDKFKLKPNERN